MRDLSALTIEQLLIRKCLQVSVLTAACSGCLYNYKLVSLCETGSLSFVALKADVAMVHYC